MFLSVSIKGVIIDLPTVVERVRRVSIKDDCGILEVSELPVESVSPPSILRLMELKALKRR